MKMKDCRPLTSPKLEKQTEPETMIPVIIQIFTGLQYEMDVQEAQEPKPDVMETVGENGQIHGRHGRLGDFHAEVWQGRQQRGIL